MKPKQSHNQCYLCGNVDNFQNRGVVRDCQDVQVLECPVCGLLFLSSFSHIKKGFYENAMMHDGNVEIEDWAKDTAYDDERRANFLHRALENRAILDIGCGTGGFLKRVRSITKSCAGVEPEMRLKEHFQDEGLTVYPNLEEVSSSYDIITMFHVFEHLPDPRSMLIQIAKKLTAKGQVIIEVPNSRDALISLYESSHFSKFTYWSCHLFLYDVKTLAEIARQSGYAVNYIKQVQRYPLSNHLYWLAFGKPGGHKEWMMLDSAELHAAYEKQLASLGLCDTLVASLSPA